MSDNYNLRLECAKRYLESIKTLKEFNDSLNLNHKSLKNTILKGFPSIHMKFKDFFLTNQLQFLFERIIDKHGILPHGNDGLIFTRNDRKYVNGVNESIVKWKPPHMNTIDFVLVPNSSIKEGEFQKKILDMYVSYKPERNEDSKLILFDFMFVSGADYQKIEDRTVKLEEFIICECNYDNEDSNPLIE